MSRKSRKTKKNTYSKKINDLIESFKKIFKSQFVDKVGNLTIDFKEDYKSITKKEDYDFNLELETAIKEFSKKHGIDSISPNIIMEGFKESLNDIEEAANNDDFEIKELNELTKNPKQKKEVVKNLIHDLIEHNQVKHLDSSGEDYNAKIALEILTHKIANRTGSGSPKKVVDNFISENGLNLDRLLDDSNTTLKNVLTKAERIKEYQTDDEDGLNSRVNEQLNQFEKEKRVNYRR